MALSKPSKFDERWIPLIVTTIGSFMSVLDTSIVNIALPSVLRDFNSSLCLGGARKPPFWSERQG
jgi:MFS family permease